MSLEVRWEQEVQQVLQQRRIYGGQIYTNKKFEEAKKQEPVTTLAAELQRANELNIALRARLKVG